jgi:hypothetical protein
MSTREERILFWLQPLPWKATPEENSVFSDTMNQLHPSGEKLFLSARPRFIKSLEDPQNLSFVIIPFGDTLRNRGFPFQ